MSKYKSCCFCGRKSLRLTREHLVPRAVAKWTDCSFKIVNAPANIAYSCYECNSQRMSPAVSYDEIRRYSPAESAELDSFWQTVSPYLKRYADMRKRLYEKQRGLCYCCQREFSEKRLTIRRINSDLLREERNACLVCFECNRKNADFIGG